MRYLIILVTTILTVQTHNTFADDKKSQLYGGVGISQLIYSGEMKHFNSNGSAFFTASPSQSSFGTSLALGYMKIFSQFVIDSSISSNIFFDNSNILKLNSGVNNVKTDWLINFNLKPGYLINDKIITFASLGLGYGKFVIEDTFNNGATKLTQWKPDISIGLGTKIFCSDKIGINLEYQYLFFRKISYHYGTIANQGSASYRPAAHILTLQFNYFFNSIQKS